MDLKSALQGWKSQINFVEQFCLGHAKVIEFQNFPKLVFSWWLKSKEIKEILCQASKHSAIGAFHSLFSPVFLSAVHFSGQF